ncbi:hypothetical protein [Vaginisenegalia massiliensis]|uniref:hypothetical protein n=1 Tax=Vaginisenegalia massiliensis TaxID=2058294 RepID=UPI000F5360A0|nr:hypothetical protein [Vaginisenegalia massiliensis]
MARPKKQTVDYFPHIATSGKTMFIIESLFGNDGYAFWFKTLELLATTEGHVINCRNSSDWEFLLAKTKLDDVMARSILDKLSDLGSIDQELWNNGLIWSQNFVDNIADVYKNRKAVAPKKPNVSSFYEQKHHYTIVSTSRNASEQEFPVQPTDENPQSKVKETKVNKTKVNHTKLSDQQLAEDFEKLWKFLPKKTNKHEAFAFYKIAIENGTTNKEIQTGIVNYNKQLAMDKTESRYFKTDVNFFKDRYWENHQEPPKDYKTKEEPLPEWLEKQEDTQQCDADPKTAAELREKLKRITGDK